MTASRPTTKRIALILGILGAFGPLSIDLYLPGMPEIARQFHTQASVAQFTLTFFLLGLTAGQMFYGPLADRFGRKRPLVVGCALYLAASVGCALSWSIWSLILFRCLQAVGCCAGIVIPRSIVRDLFDERESARLYSMLMLVMGLAPITAPLIGGQLLLYVGWRAIFWVLAGFGLLCLTLVSLGLPETLPADQRSSGKVTEALVTYGRLLCDRRFVGYALAGGLLTAGMFAYISGSPFVFIDLYGVKPEHYGWIFGTNAFGLIAVSQANRKLLKRYAVDTILSKTLLGVAVSGILLAVIAAIPAGGLVPLLIPLFICIAGIGLVGPNAAAAGMAPYGTVAGIASALLGTLQLGVGAAAGILVGLLHNGTALPMCAVIALCTVSALVAFHTLALRHAALTSKTLRTQRITKM